MNYPIIQLYSYPLIKILLIFLIPGYSFSQVANLPIPLKNSLNNSLNEGPPSYTEIMNRINSINSDTSLTNAPAKKTVARFQAYDLGRIHFKNDSTYGPMPLIEASKAFYATNQQCK